MDPKTTAIWNRAAIEMGGDTPRLGDRSLAAVLLGHNLIMNGGVHHAIEVLDQDELAMVADGYRYFGLDDAGALIGGMPDDPELAAWTEENEFETNRRYGLLVPDDGFLVRAFEDSFCKRPMDFAPVSKVE